METIEYRFGPTLRFDKDKESYIVDRLDYLNKTHSLGKFMTYIVKLVFDDPSLLRGEENLRELLAYMEKTGSTPNAHKFFKESSQRIDELRIKVDEIHKMCEHMYILALMDKLINPEKQVENVLSAEFILQRQVREISNALSGLGPTPFASDKIKNTKEDAESTLQFIIEHYSGIVNEIKLSQSPVVHTTYNPQEPSLEQAVTEPEKEEDTVDNTVQADKEGIVELDGGDPLDFGIEDMDDLANMMGGIG